MEKMVGLKFYNPSYPGGFFGIEGDRGKDANFKSYVDYYCNSVIPHYDDSTPEKLRPYMLLIYSNLENEDCDVFTYMYNQCQRSGSHLVTGSTYNGYFRGNSYGCKNAYDFIKEKTGTSLTDQNAIIAFYGKAMDGSEYAQAYNLDTINPKRYTLQQLKDDVKGNLTEDLLKNFSALATSERKKWSVFKKEHSKVSYIVVFKDWDERIIDSQKVLKGDDAEKPADPVREGYDFIGWEPDYHNVTSDLTCIAQYQIKTFTVRFFNGTTLLKQQTVNYGESAQKPEPDPERKDMVFVGYEPDYTGIKRNTDCYAQFVDAGKTKKIGYAAFKNCKRLARVSGAAAVQIGDEAFYGCESLESAAVAARAIKIGARSFKNAFFNNASGSASAALGNVVEIGEAAFENCRTLKSVSFGNILKTIGSSSFAGCEHLLSVRIPASVQRVGGYAFGSAVRTVDMRSFSASSRCPSLGQEAFCAENGLSIVFSDLAAAEHFAQNEDWKAYSAYFVPKVAFLFTAGSNSGSAPDRGYKRKWEHEENCFEFGTIEEFTDSWASADTDGTQQMRKG